MSLYDDVYRESLRDWLDERPPRERPSRDEYEDLEQWGSPRTDPGTGRGRGLSAAEPPVSYPEAGGTHPPEPKEKDDARDER